MQTKRTVVVTGANKGIGYCIIDGLMKSDKSYDLVLTARKPENGQLAAEKLQKAHKDSKSTVTVKQLNLSDPISLQHFVDWIKDERGKIDVLINNAAIYSPAETATMMLETINTNFLSTLELTEKLFPYLSQDGKIIMISSGLGELKHQGTAVRKILEDPELSQEKLLELSGELYEKCKEGKHTQAGFSESVYNATKAMLNAYTRWILVNRLKEDQQCFTVDPGWCKTDLGGQQATRTPEQGADTPIYLVELPFKLDKDLNGKFFRDRKMIDF